MRMFILSAVLFFVANSAQAATLNVVGGQLMGASGVDVGGTLYDVEFVDGTCIELFTGCDDVSDFTFQNAADALLAAQALIDSVFLDLPSGNFASDPTLTNGCTVFANCVAITVNPLALPAGNAAIMVINLPSGSLVQSSFIIGVITGDTGDFSDATYARWSSPVPEPSTALLLGLGLTGLAGKGRRRNRS